MESEYDLVGTSIWSKNHLLLEAQWAALLWTDSRKFMLAVWRCRTGQTYSSKLHNYVFVPWLPVVLNRNVWRTACLFIHWFWIITKANVIINLQPFKSSTRCCSKNWVYTFNGLDYWIKNLMFFGKNCMKSLLQKWVKFHFQVLCNSIPEF